MDHSTPVCECRQDNGKPVKKALRRNSRLDKGPKCSYNTCYQRRKGKETGNMRNA